MVMFEGEILVHTGRAIRFQGNYWEAPLWLPVSQIEVHRDPSAPFEVVIKAKPWIAKVKNILEFTYYSLEEIEERDRQ